jgi:hypothetical protein
MQSVKSLQLSVDRTASWMDAASKAGGRRQGYLDPHIAYKRRLLWSTSTTMIGMEPLQDLDHPSTSTEYLPPLPSLPLSRTPNSTSFCEKHAYYSVLRASTYYLKLLNCLEFKCSILAMTRSCHAVMPYVFVQDLDV